MKEVIWFSNSTEDESSNRTTETKYCKTLKEAIKHCKHGYIIRQDQNKTELHKYINGFVPSSSEQLRINQLTKNKG